MNRCRIGSFVMVGGADAFVYGCLVGGKNIVTIPRRILVTSTAVGVLSTGQCLFLRAGDAAGVAGAASRQRGVAGIDRAGAIRLGVSVFAQSQTADNSAGSSIANVLNGPRLASAVMGQGTTSLGVTHSTIDLIGRRPMFPLRGEGATLNIVAGGAQTNLRLAFTLVWDELSDAEWEKVLEARQGLPLPPDEFPDVRETE